MKVCKSNIISLLMAMLILLSSTGYSIDLHYCQGVLKHVSALGKAKSCHSQIQENHCAKSQKKSCHLPAKQVKKKNCCANKTLKVKSHDEAKIQTVGVEFPDIQFLTAFVQVFFFVKIDLSQFVVPHVNYTPPPLLNRDISVLIQSFLL